MRCGQRCPLVHLVALMTAASSSPFRNSRKPSGLARTVVANSDMFPPAGGNWLARARRWRSPATPDRSRASRIPPASIKSKPLYPTSVPTVRCSTTIGNGFRRCRGARNRCVKAVPPIDCERSRETPRRDRRRIATLVRGFPRHLSVRRRSRTELSGNLIFQISGVRRRR